MRRLYNEYEMLTEEGSSLDHRVSLFCREIMRHCIDDGVSLRDAELVIVNAVTGISAETLLCQAVEKRKGEDRVPC